MTLDQIHADNSKQIKALWQRVRLLESRQYEIVVNVPVQPTPTVNVMAAEQPAPVVNIGETTITMPAAKPPDLFLSPTINVPQQEAPDVIVQASDVVMPPAQILVNLPEPRPFKEVKRAKKDPETGDVVMESIREYVDD